MRLVRSQVAILMVAGAVLAPGVASAQSSLPWSDANPLEGSARPKEKPAPQKRGEARSESRATAAAKASDAPDGSPPRVEASPPAVPVPTPDPRAEDGATPQLPEAQPVPAPADAATSKPKAGVVEPVPAEAKPVDEIPVPDRRPADAPGGGAPVAEPPPPAAKPVEGEAGAEPPRPEDAPNSTEKLKARDPKIDPATSVVAAAAVEDAETCERDLKARGVDFTVGDSISEGECGVLRPIAIKRLSSGVKVGPNTQILCRTALALDTWMSDVVVPAARADFPDRTLTEFQQASTYVCRPRASETGISEHARGSAIDIGAFVFDKGQPVGVAAQAPGSPEAKFQDAVRAGACGPFKTVLGPGTDPDHATHFHLDIAARRNDATYCK